MTSFNPIEPWDYAALPFGLYTDAWGGVWEKVPQTPETSSDGYGARWRPLDGVEPSRTNAEMAGTEDRLPVPLHRQLHARPIAEPEGCQEILAAHADCRAQADLRSEPIQARWDRYFKHCKPCPHCRGLGV